MKPFVNHIAALIGIFIVDITAKCRPQKRAIQARVECLFLVFRSTSYSDFRQKVFPSFVCSSSTCANVLSIISVSKFIFAFSTLTNEKPIFSSSCPFCRQIDNGDSFPVMADRINACDIMVGRCIKINRFAGALGP